MDKHTRLSREQLANLFALILTYKREPFNAFKLIADYGARYAADVYHLIGLDHQRISRFLGTFARKYKVLEQLSWREHGVIHYRATRKLTRKFIKSYLESYEDR